MIDTEKMLKQKYTHNALNLITIATSIIQGITVKDLMSQKRDREIVDTRRIAFAIARHEYKFTLQTIGDFYQKNHATILHQITTHDGLIEHHKEYREKYEKVTDFIRKDEAMTTMLEYVKIKDKLNELAKNQDQCSESE